MKTSNKLLLGGYILITVSLVAGITIFGCSNRIKKSSSNSKIKTLTYEYNNLAEVILEGAYNVEYTQGPESRIDLIIPENSESFFKIAKSENSFSVSYKEIKNFEVKLKVTAPNIEIFDFKGKVNIQFNNSNLENLHIKSEGIANILSQPGSIQTLNIDGEGMGNFMLKGLKIKNCNFNFEGMGNTELFIDGGELSGKIEGMMNVNYYGKVSKRTLKIEGMGRIKDHTTP